MVQLQCYNGCGRSCNGKFLTCCSACPHEHTAQCNQRQRAQGCQSPFEHRVTRAPQQDKQDPRSNGRQKVSGVQQDVQDPGSVKSHEASILSCSAPQQQDPQQRQAEGSQQSSDLEEMQAQGRDTGGDMQSYVSDLQEQQQQYPPQQCREIKPDKEEEEAAQKNEREEIARKEKEAARKRIEAEAKAKLAQLEDEERADQECEKELRRKRDQRTGRRQELQKALKSIDIERQQKLQQQYRAELLRGAVPSSEKYLLLPAEHVLEQQLSDHLPQIFTCGEMNGKVRVMTWNIMTKCRYTHYSNNGFGKNEADDEYSRRLQDIAHVVALFFAQDVGLPMVAALQECPLKGEGFQALISGIRESFPSIDCKIHQTSPSFANITLCDKSQWHLQQMPTLDGLLARALITKLVPVEGPAACAPCTFVNVHLEWKANPQDFAYRHHVAQVRNAVGKCLEEDGLVVVAGDFNMTVGDTYDTPVEGVIVEQIRDSSQVWNGHALRNTVDGVIWSEGSPGVRALMDMNMGFEEKEIKACLESAGGNVNDAATMLLSGLT